MPTIFDAPCADRFVQCRENQMKNVCNMLKLRSVENVENVHAMSHVARNGGCRLVEKNASLKFHLNAVH